MSSPEVNSSPSTSWYARFWDPMSWVPTIAYLLDWDVMDETMDYPGFGRRVAYERELEAEEQSLAAVTAVVNSIPSSIPPSSSSSQGLVPSNSSSVLVSGPGVAGVVSASSVPASLPGTTVSGPTVAMPSSLPPSSSTSLSALPRPVSSGVGANPPPPPSSSLSAPVSSSVTDNVLTPAPSGPITDSSLSSSEVDTIPAPSSSGVEALSPPSSSFSTTAAPPIPPSSGVRALASPQPSSSSTPAGSSNQGPSITDPDDLANLFRGVRLDRKGKGKEKIGGIGKKAAAPKKMVSEVVPTKALPYASYQSHADRQDQRQKRANELRKAFHENEIAKEKKRIEETVKEIQKCGGVVQPLDTISIAQIQADLAEQRGDADPNAYLQPETREEEEDDDYDPEEEMRRLREENRLW